MYRGGVAAADDEGPDAWCYDALTPRTWNAGGDAALHSPGVGEIGANGDHLDVGQGALRDRVQHGLKIGPTTGDKGYNTHAPILGAGAVRDAQASRTGSRSKSGARR